MKAFRNFYIAALMAMLTVATIQACATAGYENVDTTRKAILVATAEVRGANLLLQDLVRRNAIDDASARDTLNNLREASSALQTALNAVNTAGDPVTAQNNLDRANISITIALTLLGQFTGGGT